MTWDARLPLGTESASNGDNRIRELKEDLEGALQAQAIGTESVFPGSGSPVYRYRGLKGTFAARPPGGEYGLYFDTTRNVVSRDNGTSWEDVATLIPAGTVMVFYQSAAPTGWTKITTQNDKALRVVSGSGGVAGGSLALSASLTHTHVVASHSHDLSNHTHGMENHTHAGPSHTHTLPSSGYTAATGVGPAGRIELLNGSENVTYANSATTSGADGTGSTGPPSDNISDGPSNNSSGVTAPSTDSGTLGALAYVDVILCSKDA